jgi:hypothetical protein
MNFERNRIVKRFEVFVRTEFRWFAYTAIAVCSCDVVDQAIDRFGVCGVTAKLEKL